VERKTRGYDDEKLSKLSTHNDSIYTYGEKILKK